MRRPARVQGPEAPGTIWRARASFFLSWGLPGQYSETVKIAVWDSGPSRFSHGDGFSAGYVLFFITGCSGVLTLRAGWLDPLIPALILSGAAVALALGLRFSMALLTAARETNSNRVNPCVSQGATAPPGGPLGLPPHPPSGGLPPPGPPDHIA